MAANIEAIFLTGSAAVGITDNPLDNHLRGNSGANVLTAGTGIDILEGGGGSDTLTDTAGNSLLNGGAGTDTLNGSSANDILMGGVGNDTLNTGTGADIIAFNVGDGKDTVAVSSGTDNTVSLGGAAHYADLLFTKSGNNLILKVGATNQIAFVNYYAAAANRSVATLQMVIEGTSDYVPVSSDPLHNKKVETFDFAGLVSVFDAARAANPSLTSWALRGALASQYLGGSDTALIGGDLAYRYARFNTLADMSFTPATGILNSGNFGTGQQSLLPLTSLQDSSQRLS